MALLLLISTGEKAMSHGNTKEIRTYMSFGLPVDPSDVKTLVDLDISYALSASLVDWNSSKEPVSGLASSWDFTGEKEITFRLRESAKWSDGSSVTAEQIVASLARTKKIHGDSLKSLFDFITAFTAKNGSSIVFQLTLPARQSGIIRKLTEPMYGISFVRPDGSLDLKKTTGPFSLSEATDTEIKMTANPFWFNHTAEMVSGVIIRRPPAGDELELFLKKDSWANLVASSSLLSSAVHEKIKSRNYTEWNRNLDKIFFFSLSQRLANDEGRTLLRSLSQKLDVNQLLTGLGGFSLANQFFPKGYPIHDPQFVLTGKGEKIPKTFTSRPLEILGTDVRLGKILKDNIRVAIKKLTGIEPKFILVPLNEFEKTRVKGNFDILAGSLPVNDPNIDGAVGFFFGLKPPIIPNAGVDEMDFKSRVDSAMRLGDQGDRNSSYRKIFSDATAAGSILPLFHISTTVIAKEGLDISGVPTSDESIAFSKVKTK